MKKYEKAIYITIIIILVGVISSGATYLIISNNNDEVNISKKQNINNVSDKNASKTSVNELDTSKAITLSETELSSYLSYIPDNFDYSGFQSVYKKKFSSINTISKKDLLYNSLAIAFSNYDNYFEETKLDNFNQTKIFQHKDASCTNCYYFMKETKLYSLLKKMYNLSNYDFGLIENNQDFLDSTILGSCFYYINNGFIDSECGGGGPYYNDVVIDYSTNDTELVIYANAYYFDFDGINILDAYTNKVFSFTGYEKEYIKNHTNEMTLYKHTYKKNDIGYYWYSTEVVE